MKNRRRAATALALGVRSLQRTFLGLGVSHRSGIFGTSQLLGNVSGGSNYLYSYVEWEM